MVVSTEAILHHVLRNHGGTPQAIAVYLNGGRSVSNKLQDLRDSGLIGLHTQHTLTITHISTEDY
jgi:hypothetical protein